MYRPAHCISSSELAIELKDHRESCRQAQCPRNNNAHQGDNGSIYSHLNESLALAREHGEKPGMASGTLRFGGLQVHKQHNHVQARVRLHIHVSKQGDMTETVYEVQCLKDWGSGCGAGQPNGVLYACLRQQRVCVSLAGMTNHSRRPRCLTPCWHDQAWSRHPHAVPGQRAQIN